MGEVTGADVFARGNLEHNANENKYWWEPRRQGETTRTCPTCGAEFEPRSRNQKYCRREHNPNAKCYKNSDN